MNKFLNGLFFVIVGLGIIFRLAPQLELGSMTQTFLETHGQLAVLPAQYWAVATRLVGGVFLLLGMYLVDPWGLLDKFIGFTSR